ncbi:MAG TPA: DUF1287 domain-containing protein [Clostridiaceae bacterium]
MKKLASFFLMIFILASSIYLFFHYNVNFNMDLKDIGKKPLYVKTIDFKSDINKNGKSDLQDIVLGARAEVNNKTEYKDAYYSGDYPPVSEGVCADVIWRALKTAGYNLKLEMDKDLKEHLKDYASSIKTPEPNIDFRRVKNLYIFFQKYATSLTLEVKSGNAENLENWQGGDIVVLKNPDHIAIISDKRNKEGVPYVIHNATSYAKEEEKLVAWSKSKKIIGHFRYPESY